MGKQRIKPNYRRQVLRLPDLDHCKLAVLNSLGSPASRRVYEYDHVEPTRVGFGKYRVAIFWTPLGEALRQAAESATAPALLAAAA